MKDIKLKSTHMKPEGASTHGFSSIDLATSPYDDGTFAMTFNDKDGEHGSELVKRWNEHEELVEALLGCSELLGMVTLDRWEAVAKQFRKETGFLRPGKDYPAGAGLDDEREEERNKAWKEWSLKRHYSMTVRISALLAKIGGEK